MSDDRGNRSHGFAGASLRTIVFADLVESVKHYQRNEVGAIERWRHFVAAARVLIDSIPGARIVRTAGDGLLIEMAEPGAGCSAAFRLHDAIGCCNSDEDLSAESAMWLRIGIHVARVVAEEHELYGAGVNLAARLAGLAQPGQTLLSAEARQGLVDRVHADIEDLGLRYVKHMDEPVHTFVARSAGSRRAVPTALSDIRPSVAVVPFAAKPWTPEHDALGFAMADDIGASLARHPDLRVLSRATTAAVRDAELDLPRLRQLLGVSFLLTGRFYVRGDGVRLSAELCELREGTVLWTGSASSTVDDLFRGQDDLVPQIVSQVAQQVLAHELGRVRSLPMDTLASYTLFLGASGLMNSLVRRDFDQAGDVLRHLMERHPRNAAPSAMLARWHVFKAVQGWTEDWAREVSIARSHALSSIEIDPCQSMAHSALALVKLNFEGDAPGAKQDNLRAIEADPMDPHPWAQLSGAQVFLGLHEQACESARRAIELSPLDPCKYLFEAYAAMAHLAARSYREAAGLAASSIGHHALHAPTHRLLIGARWLGGDEDGARQAAARYLKSFPAARVGGDQIHPYAAHEGWRVDFADALRSSGVPP